MGWFDQVTDIMQKYGAGGAQQPGGSVHDDFDRFTQHAPASTLSEGLAEAFRSPQTPPFANMLGELFGRSATTQKASVVNSLVASLGPMVASQILARHGADRAATELQSGAAQVTPDAADQIPPTSVEAIAKEAEQRDPSIVDRISRFYADQPKLVKTLGGLALTVAMAKMAQRQARGNG